MKWYTVVYRSTFEDFEGCGHRHRVFERARLCWFRASYPFRVDELTYAVIEEARRSLTFDEVESIEGLEMVK